MTLPLAGAGRLADLQRLEALADRTCSGHGGFVVVTGEPGIGKTHLLRAAVAAVSERMTIAWGAADSWSGTEPFGIWTQILPALNAPGATDVLSRLVAPPSHDIEPVGGGDLARLQLFDDVRTVVRESGARDPVLIVIDDLQMAHPSALELLSFLVAVLPTIPVSVIASARTGPRPDELLEGLLRQAETVPLSALDAEGIMQLLSAEPGAGVDRTMSDTIHRRSGGNPLLALELTRLVAVRPRFDDRRVPDSVMAVVAERIGTLSDRTRKVLEVAAVLGQEFRAPDLAVVLVGLDSSIDSAAAVEELERGSLIEPTDDGHRFTHGVLRDAVYTEIPTDRRQAVHRAVVELSDPVEPGGLPTLTPAERARHLLESDARDRVERAADELASAARAAVAVHAHVEALGYADDAIELVGDDGRRGAELLLDRGTALLALGDVDDARVAFRRAADRARTAEAPVLLARAALGVGSGETGFEVPLLDIDQIALLQEALERLPASASAWRARLLARLAVALTATDEAARVDASAEAVRLARAADEPATVAAALAARCDVFAGPEHTAAREEWSTEMIGLARSAAELGLELLGLRLRLVARLEQGDLVGALADADDFSTIAERLDQPTFLWYAELWRAMRLLLAGQSDAALEAVTMAAEIGDRAHSVNAEMLVLTHRIMHGVQVGDTGKLAEMLARYDERGAVPRATWEWVALAFTYAVLERPNAARLRLDAVADDLRAASRDSEWVPMLAQLAETVSCCGDHPLAEWAYEALLPHRSSHVVEGIGAVMMGSVEHPLGQLAAARGDREGAAEHFDAAFEANRRLGSPALAARTLHHAGVALDDPDRLARARELYEEMGWRRRVEQLERLDRSERTPGRSERPVAEARMVRDGAGWELGYQGLTVHVNDSKGLHDLVVLLGRPHVEVPALDLAGARAGDRARHAGDELPTGVRSTGAEGDLGPMLDDRARAAYQARIIELEEEIDEARSMGDPARLERAEDERGLIVAELKAAYGLGGAPRRPGDPAERARTTVTSRIRYSIDRIEDAHPALGRHLRNSVVTGRFCSYRPENPVTWEI